jgi:hypothetical protein
VTKLKAGRPVIRETATFERTDPIIAELHLRHLVLWLKGDRKERIEFDYDDLLRHGRRMRGRK